MLSGFSPSLLELLMQGEVLRDQEIEIVQADGFVVTKRVLEQLCIPCNY
jgi:hypothetical protein